MHLHWRWECKKHNLPRVLEAAGGRSTTTTRTRTRTRRTRA